MRRFKLTNPHRKLTASPLPKQRRIGHSNDHRTTFDGIRWVLRCGSPWRDMPEPYSSWKMVS
ncbi:MAG: transposase [Planctomycetota bacterium]